MSHFGSRSHRRGHAGGDPRVTVWLLTLICFWWPAAVAGAAAAAEPTADFLMADGGQARVPVVVSPKASEANKAVAAELARYLGKISGATFEVTPGDGKSGIVVGLAADFPNAAVGDPLDVTDPTRREDYLLRSHERGLYVLGATDLAVSHAVWDLLYRLGHRQFFPGERWEVVPRAERLSIAVDVRERPAYYARRIWYGSGAWDYAEAPYADWCAKNRATSGIQLNTGHAYDGILRANKAEFEKHPEYLGLVGGERKSSKFCISDPGLRKLAADHALGQLAKNPAADSVSADPSDGGGWCECDACAKLGSVSDRALLLANEMAAAVNEKYPGVRVGIYAYNYHSPPPTIRAHPQVVVSVATAFLKGGMTLDEILAGWSTKADTLGIREYYSVNTWDRDLPAAARGGNLAYLKRTIPEFHAKGARFMSAESSDNWGPNGLGYYLAGRMLWDVKEAGRADALVEDFLTRAFSPAKEPMREFYRQLDGSEPHLVPTDQVGRMFRALEQAGKLADTPEVRGRVDDLVLYARYVDLFTRYAKSKDAARQTAFEALIRHAYRMRRTMLVHAKALYRDLAHRDKSVAIPEAAQWNVPEGKNPWKSSAPFTAQELTQFVTEGVERYPLAKIEFEPVAYGDDLVGAGPLKPPADAPPGTLGPARGRQTFYTRVEQVPAEIELSVTGGLIAHYRDRGNVRVDLWKIGGASETGERETLAAQDRSVPPDGRPHAVKLAVKEPGLYKLTVDDGNDRTEIEWRGKLPMTVKSTADEPMNPNHGQWNLYFYVPKGTKVIGFFGGEHGELRDSGDRPVFWLNGREPNYYSADVPDGEDGKFWSVRYGRGAVRLLTVPPYFARTPAELLLPAEVVTKDAAAAE